MIENEIQNLVETERKYYTNNIKMYDVDYGRIKNDIKSTSDENKIEGFNSIQQDILDKLETKHSFSSVYIDKLYKILSLKKKIEKKIELCH